METTSSQPATYVYGIVAAEPFGNGRPPLGVPGIGGRGSPVRTITFQDLMAVVSDVPGLRFNLNRETLLEHQRVLDAVLSRSDVLPFSFGTVAHSDEEVRDLLLRDGFEALHDQLERIRGCVELEVKAFWVQEQLFAEIAQENEEVRELRDMMPSMLEAEASLARITLGQLTGAEIELKSEWEADGVLDILQQHAVDLQVTPNLSDTMLLNAAFLVEREREADFDSAVLGLGERHEGRLIFNYVGPLPPYSFIDLAFQAEE